MEKLEDYYMDHQPQENISFKLREEKLDIKKELIKTEEISWHKEVVSEEKTFKVPIMREEMVIKRKFYPKSTDQQISVETIRIPLREEGIEMNKYTFDLEEVDIVKQDVHRMETINELLKKEEMYLRTTGNPIVEIKKL